MECLIARTDVDRAQVYRLRYECYRRDHSIAARPDRVFSDAFDALPNNFSFLVRSGGEPVATVRISVVRDQEGWRDSPVQHVFGDHPLLQEIAGAGYVEASRLCFSQQARRGAFLRVVGQMAAMATFYETEWLVACPRVKHAESYRRMFRFKPVAPPRQYFGVAFQTQLLAISRKEIGEYVRDAKPMKQAWSTALEGLTRSAARGMLRVAASA